MFVVYDNGREASRVGFPKITGKEWRTAKFSTFDKAKDYALKWTGFQTPPQPILYLGIELDYNGYGDKVIIKEID